MQSGAFPAPTRLDISTPRGNPVMDRKHRRRPPTPVPYDSSSCNNVASALGLLMLTQILKNHTSFKSQTCVISIVPLWPVQSQMPG